MGGGGGGICAPRAKQKKLQPSLFLFPPPSKKKFYIGVIFHYGLTKINFCLHDEVVEVTGIRFSKLGFHTNKISNINGIYDLI